MQATMATPLPGGIGRSPLSNDSAYLSLFLSNSSVTLIPFAPSAFSTKLIGIIVCVRNWFNSCDQLTPRSEHNQLHVFGGFLAQHGVEAQRWGACINERVNPAPGTPD